MDTVKVIEEVRKRVVRKHGDMLISLNGESPLVIPDIIRKETRSYLKREDPELEETVVSYLVGLGPVDVLLNDPEVSEVMINAPDEIYIERNGRIEKTEITYKDAEEVMNILHRIVQRCGRRVNFSSPLVDARLPDGSRVNAIVPPASLNPVITIRRFVRKVFTTEDMISSNFISTEMVPFFETIIQGKANIVVCGATGCGKTTFLRWLANFIPKSERVITIEDTRELNLDHPHCIPLEASDKAGIYELMINSLRMRPDRIILGEVRGAEAFELLQAMGTGHEGSLTSVHANYGKMEAVHRLVRAMVKAGGVTSEELEGMVAETIDFLVFVKRFPDGSRRVVHVSQMSSKNGCPEFNDIFRYNKKNDLHLCVGSVSEELIARMSENLPGDIPDLRSFGGAAGA